MNAPLFLLAAPIVVAVILFFVRRWPLAVGLAAAAAAWILVIILLGFDVVPQAPGAVNAASATAWSIYGRSFTFTEQTRLVLVAAYAITGFIFVLSAFMAQSAVFAVISFATMSPLSGALMVQPFIFGAVLLLIAAGGMAMLIQGGRAGSTLAALRYLTLTMLAMPLLLAAGWMIEGDRFQFLDTVTLLIIVALLLLTASFPFQIWVAPVVSESTSLTPAVAYGVAQYLIIVLIVNVLVDQPFVYGSTQFQGVISLSAAATLILGGVLAMTARSFGQLLGYLLLLSIGAVIAVLGSGGTAVVQVALSLLLLRVFSLIMAGAGLAAIRTRALIVEGGANQFTANHGLAWRTPLGTGLFVFGCLSLAGLPLTPGFAGAWPAVLVVGQQASWLAVIMVLAIAAGAFGVLRRLIPLLSRRDISAGQSASELEQTVDVNCKSQESRTEQVVSITLIAAAVILAFFPRLVLTFAGNLSELF